ncbi:transposable element Tcb2 transposase [Trichonephila clavipes]|nr:transposable element Tcb2 transposase [Trichonephila clavipes]
MPLRHFRRQNEQLSQFERGRTIVMMQAVWLARRVARQLDRYDCVVRRCWDQWIRKMSFTRRLGSGCPRLTSRRKDRHTVEPSLGTPVPSRTIRRCLAEGHLCIAASITCAGLDAHPSTPPFGVVPRKRKLDYSGMKPTRLKRQIQIQSQQ